MRYTSTNPAYLLGEDYEMSEYPNTANPRDAEMTPQDIGRESSAVADTVALDQSTPSTEHPSTSATGSQPAAPTQRPQETPQAAARAADKTLDVNTALLESLTVT